MIVRGLCGCEMMSTMPHFLENRLIDGGEVSLTRRPHFTPKRSLSVHFCYMLSKSEDQDTAGRIRQTEKKNSIS
jgi:hypothetical protein